MTEQGIVNCISILKANYGGFNFNSDEYRAYVRLWDLQFKESDDDEVSEAVMRIISTATRRPNIAMIKNEMADYYMDFDSYDDSEAWDMALSSARHDRVEARKNWEALPEDVRKAVSVNTLVEIAMADDYSLQFIKKDFLNSYHAVIGKRKKNLMISDNGYQQIDYYDTPELLTMNEDDREEPGYEDQDSGPFVFY